MNGATGVACIQQPHDAQLSVPTRPCIAEFRRSSSLVAAASRGSSSHSTSSQSSSRSTSIRPSEPGDQTTIRRSTSGDGRLQQRFVYRREFADRQGLGPVARRFQGCRLFGPDQQSLAGCEQARRQTPDQHTSARRWATIPNRGEGICREAAPTTCLKRELSV